MTGNAGFLIRSFELKQLDKILIKPTRACRKEREEQGAPGLSRMEEWISSCTRSREGLRLKARAREED